MTALRTVLALTVLALFPSYAIAGGRFFVSGSGLDSNPCSRAAPCRTFQHAHDVASPNSEITVLDTAGYGTLHITKAISVINPGGVEAGISVISGQDAITVDAGSSDTVNLRGLTIDGLGVGNNGVTLHSAANLVISNCAIRNFTGTGVYSGATVVSRFQVIDSVISDNGGYGIFLLGQNTVGSRGAVFNTKVLHNHDGIFANVGITQANSGLGLVVSNSQVSDNAGVGIGSTAGTIVSISNSVVSFNDTGLSGSSGGLGYQIMSLGKTDIIGNRFDYDSSARICSYGYNGIAGNSSTHASVLPRCLPDIN